MASDFYRKTRELFEEFQKRELHYLNTQMKDAHFQFTGEGSFIAQDYLQKLNKREEETENTYRNIMSEMEYLDRRADKITRNLDRLTSLRTAMISKQMNQSASNVYFDKPIQNYNFPLSSATSFRDFNYEIQTPIPTYQNKDSKEVSTQTDYIFCENCNFPFTVATETLKHTPSTLNSSFTILKNSNETSLYVQSQPISSESLTNSSSLILQSSSNIKPNDSTKDEPSLIKIPSSENQDQTSATIPNENIILSPEQSNLTKNTFIEENATLVEERKNSLLKEKFHSLEDSSSVGDNIDKSISKSDDESLNHEFDFLESNKVNKQKTPANVEISNSSADKIIHNSVKTQIDSVTDNSNLHKPEEKVPAASTKPNSKSVPEEISDENTLKIKPDDDRKSESSVSLGVARSPSLRSDNLSAVSDTDSFYEKEEPQLKDSAAYQALLGNISIAKNPQKSTPYSESDSEDEVERALANATRKSSNVLFGSKTQDDIVQDTTKTEAESKPKPEPRKSISVNKPQHLSKNTRKVLGFDTSSGSEGEVQIQAKTNKKIEEDSDEFDFYD